MRPLLTSLVPALLPWLAACPSDKLDTSNPDTNRQDTADTSPETADSPHDTAVDDRVKRVTASIRIPWPPDCPIYIDPFTPDQEMDTLSGLNVACRIPDGLYGILLPAPLSRTTDPIEDGAYVNASATGDLNDDGFADAISSLSVFWGPFTPGEVHGPDFETAPRTSTTIPDDWQGTPRIYDIVPDVNGDDIDDWVGTDIWGDSYGEREWEGSALILFGPLTEGASLDVPDVEILADEEYRSFAWQVSYAGDTDGDGLHELTFYTYKEWLLFTPPFASTLTASDRIFGALQGNTEFSVTMAGEDAGDWNGDGYSDLAFLPPYEARTQPAIAMITCPCTGEVSTNDMPIRMYDDAPGVPEEPLTQTNRAGDLDADGFDDFAATVRGRAYVLRGGQEGAISLVDQPFYLDGEDVVETVSMYAGHDLDGDGTLDILLGNESDHVMLLFSASDLPF